MMRLQMIVVALMLTCTVASAELTGDFAPSIQFGDPLTDSHLIVRGRVRDIQMATTTFGEYFAEGGSDSEELEVFKVSVDIDEVLKGNDPGRQVTFDVLRDASMFRKGQEYIICARWRRARYPGSYIAGPMHGLFVASGKDSWLELPESGQGVTMSDRSLRARIATAEIPSVAGAADIVALGSLTSTWKATYTEALGREGTMQHYRLLVTQAFKGADVASTVEFVIPAASIRHMPPWARYTPYEINVGEEWLVFLRRDDEGWLCPFAGPNSLLKVVGNDIVYDSSVPYPRSMDEARDAIQAAVSHVRNTSDTAFQAATIELQKWVDQVAAGEPMFQIADPAVLKRATLGSPFTFYWPDSTFDEYERAEPRCLLNYCDVGDCFPVRCDGRTLGAIVVEAHRDGSYSSTTLGGDGLPRLYSMHARTAPVGPRQRVSVVQVGSGYAIVEDGSTVFAMIPLESGQDDPWVSPDDVAPLIKASIRDSRAGTRKAKEYIKNASSPTQ